MNFVNAYQDKEDRRAKYAAALHFGFRTTTARVLRDWTWPHVIRFFMIIIPHDVKW